MEQLKMNNKLLSVILIALSIVALGLCIKSGLDNLASPDRIVTVKGLSEKEVKADKVTWPIVTKEMGNDLPALYEKIGKTQQSVKSFLMKSGIKENEITINPPVVSDLDANEYGVNQKGFRYIITSTITVVSNNVDLVRDIVSRQGELLKEGIAIIGNEYSDNIVYEYVNFSEMKPEMMEEAIGNARKTGEQFAKNSGSKLDKIITADQGQFSIDDRDKDSPYIKKVRVVTTVKYSLKN